MVFCTLYLMHAGAFINWLKLLCRNVTTAKMHAIFPTSTYIHTYFSKSVHYLGNFSVLRIPNRKTTITGLWGSPHLHWALKKLLSPTFLSLLWFLIHLCEVVIEICTESLLIFFWKAWTTQQLFQIWRDNRNCVDIMSPRVLTDFTVYILAYHLVLKPI